MKQFKDKQLVYADTDDVGRIFGQAYKSKIDGTIKIKLIDEEEWQKKYMKKTGKVFNK